MRSGRPNATRAHAIEVDRLPIASRSDLSIPIYQDALGRPLEVPFIVIRGRSPGPVVGISAAVHGNELNGIRIIHGLLDRIVIEEMRGTLLCAPVVNVPAYQAGQRRFPEDEVDLNHVFPGRPDGTPSEQYARAFLSTFLPPCNVLIDIHTASEGRIDTMYVRADLTSPEAREMAMLMNPQIVLHGRSGDGTLRSAARRRDVPAITIEAGNPSVFQGRMVNEGELGVMRILARYGLVPKVPDDVEVQRRPVICKSSKWLRTRSGGLLETRFSLLDRLRKKQMIAELYNPFGHIVESYRATSDGIVIGMTRTPVAVPGTRYCHLGTIDEEATAETTME